MTIYDLKLSGEQIKYISDCLIEKPFKEVATIIITIQAQINEQNKSQKTEEE